MLTLIRCLSQHRMLPSLKIFPLLLAVFGFVIEAAVAEEGTSGGEGRSGERIWIGSSEDKGVACMVVSSNHEGDRPKEVKVLIKDGYNCVDGGENFTFVCTNPTSTSDATALRDKYDCKVSPILLAINEGAGYICYLWDIIGDLPTFPNDGLTCGSSSNTDYDAICANPNWTKDQQDDFAYDHCQNYKRPS